MGMFAFYSKLQTAASHTIHTFVSSAVEPRSVSQLWSRYVMIYKTGDSKGGKVCLFFNGFWSLWSAASLNWLLRDYGFYGWPWRHY
jgi:hypothetical protein